MSIADLMNMESPMSLPVSDIDSKRSSEGQCPDKAETWVNHKTRDISPLQRAEISERGTMLGLEKKRAEKQKMNDLGRRQRVS
jgi:hypothetical protein